MAEPDAPERSAAADPRWLRALYLDLVAPDPEPRAVERWLAAAPRGASHREIAGLLLRSDDACRAQIATLYRALLDRDGDPAGLDAWTASLSSGIALQDIIAGFCDSFEYKARHPSASDFVESLYQRLLARASDPAGKAARLAALRNRASSLAVIRGVLSSTEYCTQRVVELHRRLLGREPDHGELLEHIVALVHGAPLQHVVLDLVTSPAYLARATGAGAAPPGATAPSEDPRRTADPDADVLALVRARAFTAALQHLMKRHGTTVYRFCRVALADDALAEDVQQQVFLEAFRDLPGFAARSSLRTWLLGIARHRVLDAIRSRRRALAHIDHAVVEPLDPRAPVDEDLDDARLQAVVAAGVDELDEPVRTAVLMRYQQGLSFEEMAEICGEHAGTLQARVARAVRRLRGRLARHAGHVR